MFVTRGDSRWVCLGVWLGDLDGGRVAGVDTTEEEDLRVVVGTGEGWKVEAEEVEGRWKDGQEIWNLRSHSRIRQKRDK